MFIALYFHLLWRHMQCSYVWCTVAYVCVHVSTMMMVMMFVLIFDKTVGSLFPQKGIRGPCKSFRMCPLNPQQPAAFGDGANRCWSRVRLGLCFLSTPTNTVKLVDKWLLWAHIVQKTEFQEELNESVKQEEESWPMPLFIHTKMLCVRTTTARHHDSETRGSLFDC